MGLFDSAFDFLGLTPDVEQATQAGEFNPYNVNTSYGNLFYDPGSRTFTSQLSPQWQQLFDQYSSALGDIDPNQQLELYRQQAAPFEEQQRLNLENRLFAQGRLDHSQVDQPGGARRSLFDSQANADLMRQIGAAQWADQRRQALMQQILGIQGMEGGLFSAGMGYGQLGMQGQLAQSGLFGQQAMVVPNLIGSGLSGATAALMAGA